MTVGNLKPVLGTQLSDPLSSFPNEINNLENNDLEIVYGLLGNDNLAINEDSDGAVLLGGRGNDQYLVRDGSTAIILETGDSSNDTDTLVANGIKINGDETYGLTIDNRHLYFADLDTDTYILILDWQSDTVIDFFDFADSFLTFEQAQTEFNNIVNSDNPNFLGDLSWEEVETDSRLVEAEANIDLSAIGLSPDNIDEAIEEIKATENSFQDTIGIVESGTDIDGSLSTSDESYTFDDDQYYYDFYSIDDVITGDLEPGDLVDVNVSANGFEPLLFLLDSRGNVLDVSENGDLTFVVGSGEPFFLSVESKDAEATGSYTLDVDIVDEDEGDLLGATEAIVGFDSIGTSETIDGSLTSEDIVFVDSVDLEESLGDGYSLTGGTVGQQIRVSLDADFDGELGIGVFDSDFNPVDSKSDTVNDNLGGNLGSEEITFTIEDGFDYFISVNSFEPGETGNYTLTTEVI